MGEPCAVKMMAKTETLIHKRVRLAEAGENPTVIGRMASGWLVLGDVQNLRGYCVLLASPVVASINELNEARLRFSKDMWSVGDALLAVTDSYRVNYSVLGNLDGALHAHITPRYHSEPDATRGKMLPPRYDEPVTFDLEEHGQLMEDIRSFLSGTGAIRQ